MLKCLKLAFLLVLIASVSIDAKQYKCKTPETGNSVSQPSSQPDNTASSAPASQPGSQTGSQSNSQAASSQGGSQPASSQGGSQTNSQPASSQSAASNPGSNNAPIWNWRSNKSYGVNIGNWLVLERWMDWNWFDSVANGGTDEWTLCQNLGKDKAAQVLTDHWNNWLKESDVAVMAQYGINMLRVPVGFWAFIDVWDSEPYVTTGQKDQLARLMEYVDKYNMYIILDLHGMPGSQNGQDHSGHAGEIGFFKTPNLQRGLQTIQAMVDWAKASPYSSRIAAIECANEPHPYINERWPRLVQFYQDSYKIINAGGFAMMFHDGFQGLDKWSGYFTNGENAIIDLHPYWAFSGSQTQDKVMGEVCALGSQYASFHLPVFAGEFSVAATDVQGSQWWYQRFYETQYKQWLQSAGGTFWAFKAVGSLPWSWMDLVGNNAIPTDPTDVSASAC